MLHRGEYASKEDSLNINNLPVRGLRALIGMGHEFNRRDKILYLATIGWTFLWATVFISGLIYNLIFDVTTVFWVNFWRCYVWLMLILSAITTVWFTFGGMLDLKKMFILLSNMKRNDMDDGTVVDHHNLDESPKDPDQKIFAISKK